MLTLLNSPIHKVTIKTGAYHNDHKNLKYKDHIKPFVRSWKFINVTHSLNIFNVISLSFLFIQQMRCKSSKRTETTKFFEETTKSDDVFSGRDAFKESIGGVVLHATENRSSLNERPLHNDQLKTISCATVDSLDVLPACSSDEDQPPLHIVTITDLDKDWTTMTPVLAGSSISSDTFESAEKQSPSCTRVEKELNTSDQVSTTVIVKVV